MKYILKGIGIGLGVMLGFKVADFLSTEISWKSFKDAVKTNKEKEN